MVETFRISALPQGILPLGKVQTLYMTVAFERTMQFLIIPNLGCPNQIGHNVFSLISLSFNRLGSAPACRKADLFTYSKLLFRTAPVYALSGSGKS